MALHLPQSKLISSKVQSGPIQYLDSAVAETCALEKTESEIRRPNKISPCGYLPSSAVRETPQNKIKKARGYPADLFLNAVLHEQINHPGPG